jgi:hypothetical protein
MKISSPRQLKDWINNMVAKNNSLNANTLLQNFMMERLLERISVSKYKDNFILKGGFLIAAMVGIDMRSTMDMDTTIKGIPIDRKSIENAATVPGTQTAVPKRQYPNGIFMSDPQDPSQEFEYMTCKGVSSG